MRLSADRSSPYYRADIVKVAIVTLDGMTLPPVIEASEADGWADVVVYDDAGRPVVAPDRDHALIERRYGRVRIAIP